VRVAVAVPTVPWRATDRLRDAVDELVALDPAELSDRGLADELVARRRELDRQEADFARLAWAAHVRGIGSVDGAASTAAFLRHRAGMREGDARSAIECGEVTELLGETGRAWRAGEISTGAARTIVAARIDGYDAQLLAVEPRLLLHARAGDLRSLRTAIAHFRNLARADGTQPGDHDGLYLSQTFGGRTVLTGEFDSLAAETVATTLHAYRDPPSDGDTRTTAQRNAAALVQACEVALAHIGDVGKDAAHVSVIVDWQTLTGNQPGRMDGEFTGPLHPQDVERLLCDASISRIVTGPDSLPINLGRARRTPSAAQRHAIVARDQGCRWPGCNRPAGWCQAHHARPWHPDGPTDVDNLVLFCDHHHDVLHRPGWSMTFDGNELHIYRPDGTEVLADNRRGPDP
jgi:hypothetical protein